MSNLQQKMRVSWPCVVFLGLILVAIVLLCVLGHTHAMEVQEVKPYVFAELPHGRIYKVVHEGCEMYVVENDYLPIHTVGPAHQYPEKKSPLWKPH